MGEKNEEACVDNPHHKSCALDPEMRRSGSNTQRWEDEEVPYCYSIYLVIIVWELLCVLHVKFSVNSIGFLWNETLLCGLGKKMW
ncbi:hypothetical protein CEXT_404931 [Caerostris extrusa]|uniref:Uncharacterized protein n=1 Tax=Caerostris extrusa TaxID=172846 RepID=A0AAV4NRI7_CAEEX|nr:hypothetical protein CEXT_404931 [Caerostris extrusa]